MPHGGPDWGTAGPLSTVYTIEDLGELAARLGSIVTHDRRGNIIFLDDFESGIEQWRRDGDAGYSVVWDSQYCKTGSFSCKLTTGPVETRTAYIVKHIGFPVLAPFGIEVSYSFKQNWKYLDIVAWLADGDYEYYAGIRYDHLNTKLQYLDTTASPQDISDASYTVIGLPEQFDTLKFAADFSTAKYKRLLVNSQVFDLSAISFYKETNRLAPRLSLTITLTTSAAAAAIGYIDDVIITQNEP